MLTGVLTAFRKVNLTLLSDFPRMGFFEPDRGPFLIERRAARRTRATCPASLRTLTSEAVGHLWDLSETGARVSLPNPPAEGESAQLKWGTERVLCRVVWVDHDMCGLAFESPIDPAVVEASSGMLGIIEQPTAMIGNIPVGRKRSAPGAAEALAESAQRSDNLLATRSRHPGE
jgi:hypothetical protein